MSLSPGTRLGPYEIQAAIGAGGMGEVWRAHDTRLQRDVALKVLPVETLGDETARARLVREARLASKLNHPHICTIYEVGESEPSTGSGQAVAYIAMELVEGQLLSARLAEGPLPVEQVLRYGQQTADALAHAHSRGVVHRDLSTAKVVITPEDQVKVLDFGLGKPLTSDELAEATTMSRPSLAAPDVFTDALAYRAPEQLRGQAADARSDIWALGVVLSELAAGKRPFQGQTAFELSSAILSQQPPRVPSSVPAPLASVIDRCLAKEPGERYQQATEVRAALEAVASGRTGTAWRVELRRHRGLVLGTAAGVFGLLVIAAVLVGLDVAGVRTRLSDGTPVPARIIRLAVLPFANASGDAQQEYFSDGLTQELITQLGRLHPAGLEVIARTSVMRYKKAGTPLDQIGRDLKLDYILRGTAGLEGAAPGTAGHVRITAQLIKVADQAQLWAEQYERELAGILVLQSDVARKVAGALALTLLPAEQARLANARAVVPEAYDAYQRGTYYVNIITKPDFDLAEKYYTLAVQRDPDYAAAWAGIAHVWVSRNQVHLAPRSETVPKAKEAASKALQLDDTAWEPHRALAVIATYMDWDFAAAEREWKRTVELSPGNAVYLPVYSHFLLHMGRLDEAIAESERALELDPFNVTAHSFYAVVLFSARRYEDAIVEARKALSMQPGHGVGRTALMNSLLMTGRYDEHFALVREANVNAGDRELVEAMDRGYAEGGFPGSRKRVAEVYAARHGKPGGTAAWNLAHVYLAAGDRDGFFKWIEKEYEVREPNLVFIGQLPLYDPLRSDPRFQDLLRRIGLPQ